MIDCPICLDDIKHFNLYKLKCNHVFHTHCMYNLLKHDLDNYKSMGIKQIKHKRLRCPLCRDNISCKDLDKIILVPFEKYKNDYHNNKKILKKLHIQHMIFNYKYKFKKMFTRLCLYDEQQLLLQDEKFMEEISIQQNTVFMLKEKYVESKRLYLSLICVD